MGGGERMKKVCLTVLCILLVGCGNAETAETEEKMRFENLDPAKVNMQYGRLKEWDRFYNSFYEQKEGSDLIVLVDQIINNWLHFTKRLLVKFHRAYKSNDRLLDLHLLHQNIYKFCLQVPALY